MARRVTTLAVVVALAVGALAATTVVPVRGFGQATPATGTPEALASIPGLRLGLPPDVAVRPLGGGPLDLQPTAADVESGGTLRLDRITLDPDTQDVPMEGELLYVEAGEVVVVTESGLETPPYGSGGQASFWDNPFFWVRNVGPGSAVVLVVNFDSRVGEGEEQSEAMPAAKTQPGPLRGVMLFREIAGPEPTPIPGVDEEMLLRSAIPTLPEAPVVLFLVRTTWPPGSALAGVIGTGVVGLWSEAGELLVSAPENPGVEVRLAADQGIPVWYEPDTPVRLRNAGPGPAQVLILGLATTDRELIDGR